MRRFTPMESDIPQRPPDAETTRFEGWAVSNGRLKLIAQSRDRMQRIGLELGGNAISSNCAQAIQSLLSELEAGKIPR